MTAQSMPLCKFGTRPSKPPACALSQLSSALWDTIWRVRPSLGSHYVINWRRVMNALTNEKKS